jgi:hypothetical protein
MNRVFIAAENVVNVAIPSSPPFTLRVLAEGSDALPVGEHHRVVQIEILRTGDEDVRVVLAVTEHDVA